MASQDQKKRRQTAYSLGTCVVRLTHGVKEHIITKARWGESIDQTLRRIFKLGDWKDTNNNRRRTAHGR